MAILYLDVDDEITSAAARMRGSSDRRIALVLPAGSRLGTSRINFRLLSREAQVRGKTISIVAPDATTRSLAATAGLPTFATVSEYEETLQASTSASRAAAAAGNRPAGGDASSGRGAANEAGRESASVEKGTAARRAGEPPAARAASEATPGAAQENGAKERPGARSAAALIPVVGEAGARRRPRLGVVLLVLVVALALLVVGVGAWLLLPSATVDVVARSEPLSLQLTVTADPTVASPDPVRSVVPAQRAIFDLSVSDTFPATGVKIDETKATGSVRFRNCDAGNSYRIRAGSLVATGAGQRFTTDAEAFLPVAIFHPDTSKVDCQTSDVDVTAVAPGPDSNVDAGTITHVPPSVNANLVFVTNPAPTSGGTHTETKVVAQADVTAAVKQLKSALAAELKTQAGTAANVPAGTVPFADTATMSDPQPSSDATKLVDQQVETFDLGMAAKGSVTVVDEQAITAIAEDQLRAQVAADHDLVPGSIDVKPGSPTVNGQTVVFPVTATASQTRRLDADTLRAAIRGRPIDEARQILEQFGQATINTWPDWVNTIPTFDFRLVVNVSTAPSSSPGSARPAPSSSSAPDGSATVRPSGGPGKSASPAAPATSTP